MINQTKLSQAIRMADIFSHDIRRVISEIEDRESLSDLETFTRTLGIKTPFVSGYIPFKPYDFQCRILKQLDQQTKLKQASTNLLLNASRQMGITKILGAAAIYYAVKNPNETILWTSDSYTQTLEATNRIRELIESSPYELMPMITEWNKGNIKFNNGSQIIGRSCGADMGRGTLVHRLFIDNAAWISHKKLSEMWQTMKYLTIQTVMSNTGGGIQSGLFYDLWTDGDPIWRKIMLPWHEHPERDDEWFATMTKGLSIEQVKKEFCCSFSKV
jgi:terminase large subunit-like protein